MQFFSSDGYIATQSVKVKSVASFVLFLSKFGVFRKSRTFKNNFCRSCVKRLHELPTATSEGLTVM